MKGLSRRFRRGLVWAICVAAVASVLLLGAVSLYVEMRVKATCEMAMAEHPGDKMEALMAFVEAEEGCCRDKARALWALGQLGDQRALPVLEKQFTGDPEKDLCQHEAEFAIRKIEEGRFNLPAVLWRGLLNY